MTSRTDTGPFALTPEWVLDADISDRAKVLYAVLGRYADDTTGECWPSRRTLWTRLRCAERSLDAAVKELEAIGAIKRHRQPRADGLPGFTTNQWTVIRAATSAPAGAMSAPGGAKNATRGGAGTAAKNESHRELDPMNDARALTLVAEKENAKTEPYEDEFNRAWSVYPRKTARKRALRAYQAARRKGAPADVLAAAVTAYAAARQGQDAEFTMHGSTFFGPDGRWADYVPGVLPKIDAPDIDALAKRAAAGPQTGTKYEHVAPWEAE